MRHAALLLAAACSLAPAATAAAAHRVDGCNVVLEHPGGTLVAVSADGFASWSDFEAPDGRVDLVADYGWIYAPGDYLARWDDGAEEAFTIACEVEEPLPPEGWAAGEWGAGEEWGAVPEEESGAEEEWGDGSWPADPFGPVAV